MAIRNDSCLLDRSRAQSLLFKMVFPLSVVAAVVLGQRVSAADSIGTPIHHYTLTCPPAWKEYSRGAAEEIADPKGLIEHVLHPEGASATPVLWVSYNDDAATLADPTSFALGLQVGAQRTALGLTTDAHAWFDAHSLQVQLDVTASRNGVPVSRGRSIYVLGRHAIVGITLTDLSSHFDADLPVLNDAIKSLTFDAGYEALSPGEAAKAPASRKIVNAASHYRFNLPIAWTRFDLEQPGLSTSTEKPQYDLHPCDDSTVKIPTIRISFDKSYTGNPEELFLALKAKDGKGSGRPDVKIVRAETTYDPKTHRINTVMEMDLPDLPRVYSRSVHIVAKNGFADLQYVDRSGNRVLHEPAFDALLDSFTVDSAFAYPAPATRHADEPAAVTPGLENSRFLEFLLAFGCAAIFVCALFFLGIVIFLRRRRRRGVK